MNRPIPSSNLRLQAEIWQRRVKAFLYCSIATFTLACVGWSLSTPHFISETRIGLGLIEHLGESHSAEQVDRLVAATWEGVASTEKLEDTWEQIWIAAGTASADTEKPEPPPLPTGIRHELRRHGNWCELAIAVDGSGTADEKRLLDRLAVKMASELALIPYRQLIAHRNRDGQSFLLDVQLNTPRQACDEIAGQLAAIGSSLQVPEAPVPLAAPDRTQIDRQLELQQERSRLEQRRAELKREYDRLDGLNPAEPTLARIAGEILDLATQLEKIDQDLMLADAGAGPKPSPFRYASQSTPAVDQSAAAANAAITQLAGIESDTRELGRQLGRLQSQIEQHADLARTTDPAPVPVFVRSFEPARVVAQTGYGTTGIILLIGFMSLLTGSVIAWRYRPLQDDLGFDSPEQLSLLLNVPVTAELNRRDDTAAEFQEPPLSNLMVRTAELVVLTALVLVACLMIFSPEIRASFANNPLHGLTEILWKMQGR